ncbi:hypothetical protein QBC38DRAFT_508389 [Podospora fimiseda]|uniref:C2H2-type domain-containing protein n=1 Tax=Podospora fimiseda TaxID=252190 RepID=A0AAN7BTU3_9PEZI|nr:hypothetical protein QBC38DRAFT_508389 [Podospora fimiseda]
MKTFQNELSRFKVWCGNMGAHRSGMSSLDYRLRDAIHLKDQDPLDNEAAGDSDGESPETELEQIAIDVADVVNCLLRLNVDIKNPAPHQRYLETASTDTSHYEEFDTNHVAGKFSGAEEWLTRRLGKAISRRRQYFRYRESHHAKLSSGLEQMTDAPLADCETIASSIPLAMKDPFKVPILEPILKNNNSDAGISDTSYASSAARPGNLKIPPAPEEAQNGPFQCPFCYMMVEAYDRHTWKKHIYSDLRPYTCLVRDCVVAPDREFGRRHEWMQHVQRNHWKTYRCPLAARQVWNHWATAEATFKPTNPKIWSFKCVRCPLCQEVLYSIKKSQRHVGEHQEQLSLFALPSVEEAPFDDDYEDDMGSDPLQSSIFYYAQIDSQKLLGDINID